jgi:hypothetical protein
MHIEESGFESAVRLCGSKLGYVHIGESHRYVEHMIVDIHAVLETLQHVCMCVCVGGGAAGLSYRRACS